MQLYRHGKRQKLDSATDINYVGVDVSIYSSDLTAQDEDDELYGTSTSSVSTSQLAAYNFIICDSILNIGPIVDSIVTESVYGGGGSPQEMTQKKSLEIVTCSGYGKNGALCILQVSGIIAIQNIYFIYRRVFDLN